MHSNGSLQAGSERARVMHVGEQVVLGTGEATLRGQGGYTRRKVKEMEILEPWPSKAPHYIL